MVNIANGNGPPSTVYALPADMEYYIFVDKT